MKKRGSGRVDVTERLDVTFKKAQRVRPNPREKQ